MTAKGVGAARRHIVEVKAGAHLYGTATERSDLDVKAVFVPAARDILLQRAQHTVTEARARPEGERNAPGDVDTEAHSLQRYLDLLAAGQPIAVELLFAPDSLMLRPPDPLWREVQAIGPRLLTQKAGVFLRYCRQQAEKFGAKGARAAAARRALLVLEAAEAEHGRQAELAVAAPALETLAAEADGHVLLSDIEVQPGRFVRHLEVCGRKAPYTASIHFARQVAARLVGEYGTRALAAERDGGVDWKALSHAVRVGQEAIELLGTGRLRFPLAGAAHLLAIKLGQVPYDAVSKEIEALLGEVERAAEASMLPERPDLEAAEELVLRIYREAVLAGLDG